MGVHADPGSYRWCQALSRSRSFAITTLTKYLSIILLIFFTIIDQRIIQANSSLSQGQQDAIHITAILGESVVFNCHVEFPGDHPVPYVLQWEKKVSETLAEIPIYIWYENYPTHSGEGYEGRVSRVSPDSPFGVASLNLTNIRESDQGWYECKVVFLNRSPNQHKNGSWFHLDVHAPPRFSITPDDIVYVNLGDSIINNCQADGTPTPEILWYKDGSPVNPSSTVGIFNDGTELRISTIRDEDIGDYTCIARNGEGQVSHTARVIIAGGAVIMVPPTNQTKLEGEKATFTCEARGMPGNVTVRWFRENLPVREVVSLETRVTIRKDGSLIINPVSAEDSGQYLCEVSNGIGEAQSASAYLNVEYPAKVTFTPTVQYLPFRLAGVVQCYIKSNPPLQYVTWTKDKRLLEPYQTKEIVIMNNGSLLFTRVNENHQGRYTCTPYNAQGTQGSSGTMEVLVRKPPSFLVEPDPLYQRKVGESVEMHCDAQEAEGTQRPTIQWQRRDGIVLQRNRVKVLGGNITIENLRRDDFGYYQCVASNEVATIVTATQLVIEGTQPHAPYNVTGTATESSITMSWMPGYSGGPDYKQDYTIYYREGGVSDWSQISVTPSGSTQVTINNLSPGTTYEFQVAGKNVLGDGMMSKVQTIRTLDTAKSRAPKPAVVSTEKPVINDAKFPTMSTDIGQPNINRNTFNKYDFTQTMLFRPAGPKSGPPRNLTVTEIPNGFLITWQQPLERVHLVKHYTIKYRTDAQWKTLNRGHIRSEDTSYLVKNLVGGRTYYFRVLANSEKSYESSEEVKFPVPARVKHKAITAGVVGGILFFIVAIILSICAVKICNKRKRRKQEKAYNMVACRITDARQQQQQNQHQNHQQTIQTATNTTFRTGSDSNSQVPLKKYRKSRIPGLNLLATIIHWIWPSDRCDNCHSIYRISHSSDYAYNKNLDHIHRAADGRFILVGSSGGGGGDGVAIGSHRVNDITASIDEPDHQDFQQQRPISIATNSSGSDDGGFLSKRSGDDDEGGISGGKNGGGQSNRKSWRRRPLVASPSQLSFRSDDNFTLLETDGLGFGGITGPYNQYHQYLGGLLAIDHSGGGIGVGLEGGRGVGGIGNVDDNGVDVVDSIGIGINDSSGIGVSVDGSGLNYYQQIPQHLLQTVPVEQHLHHHLHHHHHPSSNIPINTISGNIPGPMVPYMTATYATPSKISRIISSSPTISSSLVDGGAGGAGTTANGNNILNGIGHQITSPWSPHTMYFSDLSSVQQPSSAERSFRTPQSDNIIAPPFPQSQNGISQLRYLQQRYSQELPSLRTIHEETKRMAAQGFVPLQIQMHSPSWRSSHHQHPQQMPLSSSHQTNQHQYQNQNNLTPLSRYQRSPSNRLLPRYARITRSAPDLGGSPSNHLIKASPESRSSSSGFGSKNTSTQQNQSSQSGSTIEWRFLPPYRPPPPAPQQFTLINQQQQQQQQLTPQSPVPISQYAYENLMPSYHHDDNMPKTYLPIQYYYHSPSQHQQQKGRDHNDHPLNHLHQLPSRSLQTSNNNNNNNINNLHHNYHHHHHNKDDSPPYTMGHWLELITRLNAASENVNIPKAVDVGSVDGHYEFDPATPTPTASTPTGPRDEQLFLSTLSNDHHHNQHTHPHHHHLNHHQQQLMVYPSSYNNNLLSPTSSSIFSPTTSTTTPQHHVTTTSLQQRKQRLSKYENIESRVQAMKEEFQAYRKRQAIRHDNNNVELESAC